MSKQRIFPIVLIVLLMVAIAPVSSTIAQQQTHLSDSGPWLLYLATAEGETLPYLWGINADGTGLTRLSEQPVLNFAVNPKPTIEGHQVAYVGSAPDDLSQELALYFLNLPDGGTSDPISLTSEDTAIHDDEDPEAGVGINQKSDIAAFLADDQGLAWSPNGQWLAFVGAMDGPSVDLYSYQLATGTVRWLTNGPTHAFQLFWTADSGQIIHTATDCILCAGGFHESANGIWGAAPDGTGITTYEGPVPTRFVAWQDPTRLFIDSGDRNGEWGEARILDIANKTITPVDLGAFTPIAYNEDASHAVLYMWGDSSLMQEGQGFYLVDLKTQEAIFIHEEYADVWWDRHEGRFLIAAELGYIAVTTDGTITPDAFTTSQVPSPDGRLSAWFDSASHRPRGGGLWLQTGDKEPVELLDTGGVALEWSPDGQSFFYDIGYSGLYLVIAETMQAIPLFTEPGLLENHWPYSALKWQATWVAK